MNDIKLIEAVQNGDADSFGTLYELYVQKLYSFIYHKTLNHEIAEDLTSETFLKAQNKIKQFNPKKAQFNTWLFTIARNVCIDFFRSYRATQSIEEIWDFASDEKIELAVETVLISDQIKVCMKRLTSEQREILTMRFWQDLSYGEIGEILGKSPENIKMITSRSIKKLREIYPASTVILLLTYLSL